MGLENLLNHPLVGIKERGQILNFSVNTMHPEYTEWTPIWKKCRDARIGQRAIKSAGITYLQKMNGQSPQEYENYKERAQWYGATGRTVESYLGMIYRKEPHIVIKESKSSTNVVEKELFDKDVYYSLTSSKGKSFSSLSRDVVEELIVVNRVGMLIDYPSIDPMLLEGMSKFDSEKMNYKPLLSMYKTESIINWHYEYINNIPIPVLFVLKEEIYDTASMGALSPTKVDSYRVLFLEPYFPEDGVLRGRYKEMSFIETTIKERGVEILVSSATNIGYPQKDGEYIDHIPFYIMTDTGIEFTEIKDSMIYDLSETNIGHYRNSADWENELHIVGAKTAIFPGWDKKTNGNPVLGGALACSKGCEPYMLEASSDSGNQKEMDAKEMRMSVLGAERISQKGRYMPSTETAKLNTSSEASTLTGMATFASEAFSEILTEQLQWDKNNDYVVDLTLNTDYYLDDISGDELLKWMDAYQRGGISYDIYYYNLEKKEAFPPEWDKEKELASLEESLERQTNLQDEKFISLSERLAELEDVNSTITTTSTGNTMMSLSTAEKGAGQSTSVELDTSKQRNNETSGTGGATPIETEEIEE
jgi:hypothetical protein